MKELSQKLQKLYRCLKRAEKHFKRSKKSAWGLGLTYYQHGVTLIFFSNQTATLQNIKTDESIGDDESSNLSRQNLPREGTKADL